MDLKRCRGLLARSVSFFEEERVKEMESLMSLPWLFLAAPR